MLTRRCLGRSSRSCKGVSDFTNVRGPQLAKAQIFAYPPPHNLMEQFHEPITSRCFILRSKSGTHLAVCAEQNLTAPANGRLRHSRHGGRPISMDVSLMNVSRRIGDRRFCCGSVRHFQTPSNDASVLRDRCGIDDRVRKSFVASSTRRYSQSTNKQCSASRRRGLATYSGYSGGDILRVTRLMTW